MPVTNAEKHECLETMRELLGIDRVIYSVVDYKANGIRHVEYLIINREIDSIQRVTQYIAKACGYKLVNHGITTYSDMDVIENLSRLLYCRGNLIKYKRL